MNTKVKFCKDCKYSAIDETTPWTLNCQNPIVNSKDAWALAYATFKGTGCETERRKTGWFVDCGQKGKLWEPKLKSA